MTTFAFIIALLALIPIAAVLIGFLALGLILRTEDQHDHVTDGGRDED